MILFLTSSPCGTYGMADAAEIWEMSRENGFSDRLLGLCKDGSRWMIIAADPEAYDLNDQMAKDFFRMMSLSKIPLSCMDLCDRRNAAEAVLHLNEYDGIILGGGHVPTQHRFLEEISLKEKIAEYDGIVMGISAGTMNCADVVYSTPELPGEAVDPDYERWLPGLGLTDIMVIPHIQKARYDRIDGLRLIEDIAVPDSAGNLFYALPDGSYIIQKDGKEVLYGEALRIMDGEIREIGGEEGLLLSCYIQEGEMKERRQAHDYLKEKMDFPEYYGKNLDALFDLLTEVDHLVVYYEAEEGEGPFGIREVFKEAAEENPGLIIIMEDNI